MHINFHESDIGRTVCNLKEDIWNCEVLDFDDSEGQCALLIENYGWVSIFDDKANNWFYQSE